MASNRTPTARLTVAILVLCVVVWMVATYHRQQRRDLSAAEAVGSRSGSGRSRYPDYKANQQLLAPDTTVQASKFSPLSQDIVERVEKFVYFIGYPRSGHSIIGSMMDAHPNMIISHEYDLFGKWMDPHYQNRLSNKTYLFNELYMWSYKNAIGNRRSTKKGYTLEISSPWQGKFTKLKVIGDKGGGKTSHEYFRLPYAMKKYHSELVATVGIPVRVLHVVRNPYDMIATKHLYNAGLVVKQNASEMNKYNNSKWMRSCANRVFKEASAVKNMLDECNLTVLELHHADFVRDPKKTLRNICDFLEVECPEDYLQVCYDKTFKTLSKTRNHVVWTEEMLNTVEEEMKKYPFFSRYSFTSED